MESVTEKKDFTGGNAPTAEDFITTRQVPVVNEADTEADNEAEQKFETVTETLENIKGTDKKGGPVIYKLISGNRIAAIRKGKGKDVERATMESGGGHTKNFDHAKYMSSLMAATTTIDGNKISMYDLAELDMPDYIAIQVTFTDLNF